MGKHEMTEPTPPTPETAQDVLREGFQNLSPVLQKDVTDYLQKVIEAEAHGQQVSIPTVTVTNMQGNEIKVLDAKNRAWRTLLQNFSFDVLVAILTLFPMLTAMNFSDKAAWAAFGTAILKTVFNVVASYVSRLAVEPTITPKVAS